MNIKKNDQPMIIPSLNVADETQNKSKIPCQKATEDLGHVEKIKHHRNILSQVKKGPCGIIYDIAFIVLHGYFYFTDKGMPGCSKIDLSVLLLLVGSFLTCFGKVFTTLSFRYKGRTNFVLKKLAEYISSCANCYSLSLWITCQVYLWGSEGKLCRGIEEHKPIIYTYLTV